MTFEGFVEEFYPHILVKYKRSKLSWDDLTPGTIVLTLRSGFGGGAGLFRRVTDEFKKTDNWEYKHLAEVDPKPDQNYRSNSILMREDNSHGRKERWWQHVVPVDYDYIMSLPGRKKWDYIDDITDNKRAF